MSVIVSNGKWGGRYFLLEYFFCLSYFFTGCELIYIACRCLRCVQGEPRVSWWRALMTKAVLPSGTRYDIHSFKVSLSCLNEYCFSSTEWKIKEKWNASNSLLELKSWRFRELQSLWWGSSLPVLLDYYSWKFAAIKTNQMMVLQDFINFIPDYPHIEFTQECKVGPAPATSSPAFCIQIWLQGWITQGVTDWSADEERRHSGFLLDQLERNCLRHWPGNRVLPGKLSSSWSLSPLSGQSSYCSVHVFSSSLAAV